MRMRWSSRLLGGVLAASSLLCLAQEPVGPPPPGNSGDVPASPFSGKGVEGEGRACNGSLRIEPHRLTWETSWSSCSNVAYDTLEERDGVHHAYRLKTEAKSCRYHVLIVDKAADSGFWSVTGYSTVAAWHAANQADSQHWINCPMY